MVRTPGRRYWETHWHVRAAGAFAVTLLTMAVWVLFTQMRELKSIRPVNPHYNDQFCFECHERNGSAMKADDCMKCHDPLTRALLPNAFEDRKRMMDKRCSHPIKIWDAAKGRTVTQLCLGCHKTVNGYVALMNISKKMYVEVDMSLTHPIGLMPTLTVRPRTLPLGPNGSIECITCHDQHATDKRLRMLRLYYPGNGHPADFRPLCNDCHADGWHPLKPEASDSVREVPRREM